MPAVHLSYTSSINKPGATPVLTVPQIWAGLQRKVRFAQEFVPVIESCTVLEEKDDGTVVRDVKFKEGAGPKPQARETVREYWPSWVSERSDSFLLFFCAGCFCARIEFVAARCSCACGVLCDVAGKTQSS